MTEMTAIDSATKHNIDKDRILQFGNYIQSHPRVLTSNCHVTCQTLVIFMNQRWTYPFNDFP